MEIFQSVLKYNIVGQDGEGKLCIYLSWKQIARVKIYMDTGISGLIGQ